jgi:hypothetical protein
MTQAVTTLLWNDPAGPVRAGIIVQHGFARSPRHMAGIAELLAERGYLVVRPHIQSFRVRGSLHDATWLDGFGQHIVQTLRDRAGGVRLIGIGHSAGAAVVCGWAQHLDGLVLLDPVDRHRRIATCFAGDHPPSRVITADPSACNQWGAAVRRLCASGSLIPGRDWVSIAGSAHADPERIPASLQPRDVEDADLLARLACGRGGSAEVVCRWGAVIGDYVDDLITPPTA